LTPTERGNFDSRAPTPQPQVRTNDPTTNRPTSDDTPTSPTSPTQSPTRNPTRPTFPTGVPTVSPTTGSPTSPTSSPTDSPTKTPTDSPTKQPTDSPTEQPTGSPTQASRSNHGTCQDNCGWKGTASQPDTMEIPNCFCDSTCETFMDCCLDYDTYCRAKNALLQGTCAGSCGRDRGFPNSCYCDAGCEQRRDCCTDYHVCNTDFPLIRLEQVAPVHNPPSQPPVCRNLLICSATVPQNALEQLKYGACETYETGALNDGKCTEDSVHGLCPYTCGGDDLEWNAGYGNCSSYGYDMCQVPGGGCNHWFCEQHGASSHCPVACGVCRMEEVSEVSRAVSVARSTRTARSPQRPQRVGRASSRPASKSARSAKFSRGRG